MDAATSGRVDSTYLRLVKTEDPEARAVCPWIHPYNVRTIPVMYMVERANSTNSSVEQLKNRICDKLTYFFKRDLDVMPASNEREIQCAFTVQRNVNPEGADLLFRPQWGFDRGIGSDFDKTLGGVPKDKAMNCPSVLCMYASSSHVWESFDFKDANVSFHPDHQGNTLFSPNGLSLGPLPSTASYAVLYRTNYNNKVIYGIILVLSDKDHEAFKGKKDGIKSALMSTELVKNSPELQQILGICVDK